MAATLQREAETTATDAPHGVRVLRDSLAALGLALLGGGLGALILFAEPVGAFLFGWDNPLAHGQPARFVALPQTQLWLFAVGAQTALMAILLAPAWQMAREVRVEREPAAALAGLALVIAVVAVFFVIAAHVRPDYAFPHHDAKAYAITGLGLLACAPAILTIWRVQGGLEKLLDGARPRDVAHCEARLRRFDRTQPGDAGNPIAGFLRLRELVHRSLLLVGALIGGAILGAGALRNAVNTFYGPQTFPIEYVLLYGVFFTVLLTVIYLPTYVRLQATGRWLVEHYVRLCEPTEPDWDSRYAKRTQLIQLLQLELTLGGSLQAGAAILAPLATSLLGLLLPSH
jgi:hypothetical protein